MCGRYAASRSPEDLAEEFEVDELPKERLEADFNVAPTKKVYAVLERVPRTEERTEERAEKGAGQGEEKAVEEPHRRLQVVKWGLVPSWAKDPSIGNRLVNARMETAADKPSFRKAFATRRCLLPADGYFEWYQPEDRPGVPRDAKGKPRKQPFFIRPRGGGVLAMAGLYEIWRDRSKADDDPGAWLWTCTVLTTEAEDDLGRIHDRMPLLVEPERYEAWLDPRRTDPDEVRELLVPAAPGLLEAYPVSTEVNNVRNNGAHLLDPVPAEGEERPGGELDDSPGGGADQEELF